MSDDKQKPKLRFDVSVEELKAIYEKLKAEFSLADLKAFDVDEKDIVPFSTLIAEVEAMVQDGRKRKSG